MARNSQEAAEQKKSYKKKKHTYSRNSGTQRKWKKEKKSQVLFNV